MSACRKSMMPGGMISSLGAGAAAAGALAAGTLPGGLTGAGAGGVTAAAAPGGVGNGAGPAGAVPNGAALEVAGPVVGGAARSSGCGASSNDMAAGALVAWAVTTGRRRFRVGAGLLDCAMVWCNFWSRSSSRLVSTAGLALVSGGTTGIGGGDAGGVWARKPMKVTSKANSMVFTVV